MVVPPISTLLCHGDVPISRAIGASSVQLMKLLPGCLEHVMTKEFVGGQAERRHRRGFDKWTRVVRTGQKARPRVLVASRLNGNKNKLPAG